MIKTTLELLPGDRVRLTPNVVRTVATVTPSSARNMRGEVLYSITYAEGRTSDWCDCNGGRGSMTWDVEEAAADDAPPFTVRDYVDPMGRAQTAVDGPRGTFLVTRDRVGDPYAVWKSDSLSTIARTVDHTRAVQAAISAATRVR